MSVTMQKILALFQKSDRFLVEHISKEKKLKNCLFSYPYPYLCVCLRIEMHGRVSLKVSPTRSDGKQQEVGRMGVSVVTVRLPPAVHQGSFQKHPGRARPQGMYPLVQLIN